MSKLTEPAFTFIRFLYRRIFLTVFMIFKHFWRHLFSSSGLLLSMLVVVTIIGALRPLKEMIIRKMEGTLPSEMIRLTPRSFEIPPLAFFSKQRDLKLGISDRQLGQIRTWPGVKKVSASQILQTPAIGRIEHALLAHMNWQFDIMLQGASDSLVRPYLKCMKDFRPGTFKDKDGSIIPLIPMLAPESYADIASAYAMINGLPAVQSKNFLGVKIRITLGRSVMGFRSNTEETIMGQLCGFLPAGIVSTLAVPLPWVMKSHRDRDMKNAASHYDQVFVTIDNPKNITPLIQRAKNNGLTSPPARKKYTELYSMLNKADYIFRGFAAVLLFLTSISLINAFTLLAIEKKYEFGLFLVFGASPFFLWFLMFLEGAFWGFLHGSAAVYISGALFPYLKDYLSGFPLIQNATGDTLTQMEFVLTGQEKFYVIAATTIFSGISSLIPAVIFLGKRTLSLVKKD